MPKKFDRCIRDVKKSLKKYHRKGNAYAICSKVKKKSSVGMRFRTEKELNDYMQGR